MRRVAQSVPVESLTGEHKLLLGIIGQAVSDYVTFRPNFVDRDGVTRRRPEHLSAERFLFGQDIWAAEALGVNTEYVHRVISDCQATWSHHAK